MKRPSYEQVVRTYERLAREAKYRPTAPGDGLGNITVPVAELDLPAEAAAYAVGWGRDEQSMDFFLGCPSFDDRPALIFIVEAARLLNGVERKGAAHLLRMALAELEGRGA